MEDKLRMCEMNEWNGIPAGVSAGTSAAQPLLIPHDYRTIKVSEETCVTIDVEETKRRLEKSFYPPIGLDYGA